MKKIILLALMAAGTLLTASTATPYKALKKNCLRPAGETTLIRLAKTVNVVNVLLKGSKCCGVCKK